MQIEDAYLKIEKKIVSKLKNITFMRKKVDELDEVDP